MQQKITSIEACVIKGAIFLGLLGFLSLNIYLPAIQSIATDFHIPVASLKLSITLFLLGFSISQFYWGSISSKYGRKKAIRHGLMLANLGTLFAIFATNIYVFNSARLIEGIGIGCASVLCRTLLTDTLVKKPPTLSWALSLVVSLANLMPAVAPLIGGYIVLYLSWRSIFVVLFIYTLILTVLIERNIMETNQHISHTLTLRQALLEYVHVFSSRKFMGYALPYLVLAGGMIGYYSATPFIFITALHIAPEKYSYLLIVTVLAYIAGASISGICRSYIDFNGTILLGIICTVVAAVLYLFLSYISHLNIFTVIIPIIIYIFGCGLVSPTANTKALSEMRHIAGASSAVLASSVYGAGALFTIFITNLNLTDLHSLMIYVMSIASIALISFYWLILLPNMNK